MDMQCQPYTRSVVKESMAHQLSVGVLGHCCVIFYVHENLHYTSYIRSSGSSRSVIRRLAVLGWGEGGSGISMGCLSSSKCMFR